MTYQNKNITALPMHQRMAELGIGYLTQEPSVFRKFPSRKTFSRFWKDLQSVSRCGTSECGLKYLL